MKKKKKFNLFVLKQKKLNADLDLEPQSHPVHGCGEEGGVVFIVVRGPCQKRRSQLIQSHSVGSGLCD